MNARVEDRFWSKVKPTEGVQQAETCWEWAGSTDASGYGMFRVSSAKVRRAHRVAFELMNGPVPDGTVFLHLCDNPPCVRPSHLRPGSRAENNADRDRKGRHVALVGEDNGNARLTADDVAAIRGASIPHGGARAVAEQYGIALSYLYQLRCSTSKLWKVTA